MDESPQEGFHYGARLSFGKSRYSTTAFDKKATAGNIYEGAILLRYGFEDWFALRSDLQLTFSQGSVTGLEFVGNPPNLVRNHDEFSNIGLAIPVLAHFNFPFRRYRPYIDGGGVVQFNLKNTETRSVQSGDTRVPAYIDRKMADKKPASIAMQVNIGFEVPYGTKLAHFYEVKWQPYFTHIGESSGADISFRAVTLSAGILF